MNVAVSSNTTKLWQSAMYCLTILFAVCAPAPSYGGMAVISHDCLQGVDKTVVGRIYTGRTVQIAGIAVQPVNMKAGDARRAVFLGKVLQQSDDDYVAYWIVRRSIGKGTPPPEVDSPQAMINFVRSTKNAIGYIDEADLIPGLNVLLVLR